MNERERLGKLILDSGELCNHCNAEFDSENIAQYLLENGVVLLPCKKGEKVFEIIKDCFSCSHCNTDYACSVCICERKSTDDLFDLFEVDWDKDCVYAISETHFNYNMVTDMGETVFLTREEAEKKLKG